MGSQVYEPAGQDVYSPGEAGTLESKILEKSS